MRLHFVVGRFGRIVANKMNFHLALVHLSVGFDLHCSSVSQPCNTEYISGCVSGKNLHSEYPSEIILLLFKM